MEINSYVFKLEFEDQSAIPTILCWASSTHVRPDLVFFKITGQLTKMTVE